MEICCKRREVNNENYLGYKIFRLDKRVGIGNRQVET